MVVKQEGPSQSRGVPLFFIIPVLFLNERSWYPTQTNSGYCPETLTVQAMFDCPWRNERGIR